MTQQLTLSTERLLAARNAVFIIFALNGMAFATWASRIPDVKQTLGLTAGQLGVTLLALSLGSIVGLPASGWLSHRLGAAGAVRIGLASTAIGQVVVGVGVDVVGERSVVAAGLFAVGLGVGVWDVGMNLEGATVERRLERNIMPRFHAAFSGGTVVSALIGALMAWRQVPVTLHLLVGTAVIVAVSLWAIRSFLPHAWEAEETGGAEGADAQAEPGLGVLSAWTEPRTLLIGLLTLVAAFTEGTANDWVSVAFVEGYDLPTWAGVLAFATFLSFMTLGRILGTGLLDRYGRVPVLRVMFVGAGAGQPARRLRQRPAGLPGRGHLGPGRLARLPRGHERGRRRTRTAPPHASPSWRPSATPRSSPARRCWASSATTTASSGPSSPSAPCCSSRCWWCRRCASPSRR